MSDFEANSVAYGLKMDEFDDLSPDVKRKLVRLMARLAEQSYRRGFQHGTVLGKDARLDPGELRYGPSLDESPYTNSSGGHSSSERLFMECAVLNMLGFDGECGGGNDGQRPDDVNSANA